jgi:eukaryotic-like serine/threonine-protein kinase
MPKTCTPLWTSNSDGSRGGSDSTPAVVGGFVYAAVDGALQVYDAAGSVGCSGIPKRCAPLWSAYDLIGFTTSPTVVSGVVYVGSSSGALYAFDAAGSTGCSGVPKVCAPLWTTGVTVFPFTTPAVANRIVYVAGNGGKVYAYDATGSSGCSGVPKRCMPLWTAPLHASSWAVTAPVVASGTVFVTGEDGQLYALNAAGSTGCSGTPKTCVPSWTAQVGSVGVSSPAVANGVVYIGADDLPPVQRSLLAFDASGVTGCSGTPKTCVPLWGSADLGRFSNASPIVANGVVYAGGNVHALYAFNADGSGCPGAPKVCAPLAAITTDGSIQASASVANGVVYVGTSHGIVHALHL